MVSFLLIVLTFYRIIKIFNYQLSIINYQLATGYIVTCVAPYPYSWKEAS